jgi:SAM-dependent methyltransferase
MNNYIHNNIIDAKIREIENNYNNLFLDKIKIINTNNEFISLTNRVNIQNDQHGFMTVWFRNIDRLMNLVPKEYDLSDYSFCDIGCGTGNALIYTVLSYRFKKYYGFDFDEKLIKIGIKNLYNLGLHSKIELSVDDASKFIQNDTQFVYFMFNPFGQKTMSNFLINNIESLKKSKSIILYANDILINEIFGYKEIIRDNYFNISVILF